MSILTIIYFYSASHYLVSSAQLNGRTHCGQRRLERRDDEFAVFMQNVYQSHMQQGFKFGEESKMCEIDRNRKHEVEGCWK